MFIDLSDTRKTDRLKAVGGAFLFEALLGYALIVGLGVRPPAVVTDQLKMVGLLPDRPPPPPKKVVPPKPKPSPEKEGAAAPPNIRSKPTEIVRPPPPPLPLPIPPAVAAAPIAGTGAASTAGAAPVPGPGTGSGGIGNGTGSGNGGNGGGSGGQGTGPRWVKGRIKDKDYPRGAGEAGVGGAVTVRYVVQTDGHATDCIVVRSSGHADLDETTCRLIEQRFRYKPATDRNGRPVAAVMEGRHEWIIGEPPKDEDDKDDGN